MVKANNMTTTCSLCLQLRKSSCSFPMAKYHLHSNLHLAAFEADIHIWNLSGTTTLGFGKKWSFKTGCHSRQVHFAWILMEERFFHRWDNGLFRQGGLSRHSRFRQVSLNQVLHTEHPYSYKKSMCSPTVEICVWGLMFQAENLILDRKCCKMLKVKSNINLHSICLNVDEKGQKY